jgi:hypothetical protein
VSNEGDASNPNSVHHHRHKTKARSSGGGSGGGVFTDEYSAFLASLNEVICVYLTAPSKIIPLTPPSLPPLLLLAPNTTSPPPR